MNDHRELWQRIADAEWMAREGYSLDSIIEQTKLSPITAHCTVSRVLFGFDLSGLKKNRKDE
jgi:hypothetical protein